MIPGCDKNLEYDVVVYHQSDMLNPVAFIEIDGGTHFFPSCYLKDENKKVEALKNQLLRDNMKNNYWSQRSFFARIPVMCFNEKGELDTIILNIIVAIFFGSTGLYLARRHMYEQARKQFLENI